MIVLFQIMCYVDLLVFGGLDVMKIVDGFVLQFKVGEVLIRVYVVGVNRLDVVQCQGIYLLLFGVSLIFGFEVVGEIVVLGDGVLVFLVGDKVVVFVNGGGYVEYCVVLVGQVLFWLKGFDVVCVVVVLEIFFIVWVNVFDMVGFKVGEKFFVYGGMSGIGMMVIQFVKVFGVEVYMIVGFGEKCFVCV